MKWIKKRVVQLLTVLICFAVIGETMHLAAYAEDGVRAVDYRMTAQDKEVIAEEISEVENGKLEVDNPNFWSTYHEEYENDSEYIKWYTYYQQNGFDPSDDAIIRTQANVNPYTNLTYTHDAVSSTNKEIVYGIDVSYYQGTINWAKVKAAGIDYAIIRAGYGRELSQKDKTFEYNYASAKANGVKVGVYWYSYANSVSRAKEEAATCLEVIKGKTFDLPVWFDQEYEPDILKLSSTQRTNIVKTFVNAIKADGYDCGLYCSRSFLEQNLNSDQIIATGMPLWLARYGLVLNSQWETDHWQYSSKGKVSGISGNVDCDFWYADIQTADTPITPATGTVETTTDAKKEEEEQTPTTEKTPAQVTGLTATETTSNSIKLTWSAAKDAKDYCVYVKKASDTKYKALTVTATNCSLTGLSANTKYNCLVRARSDSKVLGKKSAELTVSTAKKVEKPAQVTGLKKTSCTQNSVSLSWSKTSGATGYQVLYSDVKGGTFKEVGTTTKTSYTVKSLKASTGYYFKVCAVNDDGQGKQSSALGAVTSRAERLKCYTKKELSLKKTAEEKGETLISIPKHTVLFVAWRQKGSDGAIWYRMNYTVNGKTYSGYLLKSDTASGWHGKAKEKVNLMSAVNGGKVKATLNTTEGLILYEKVQDKSGKTWRKVVAKRDGKLVVGYCRDNKLTQY